MGKTEWASECVIFLGILLDGKRLILAVPEDKGIKVLNALKELADPSKKKVMVKTLQQLCGFLNFICKAIFPGRAFTRRMYAKFSHILSLDGGAHSALKYK